MTSELERAPRNDRGRPNPTKYGHLASRKVILL